MSFVNLFSTFATFVCGQSLYPDNVSFINHLGNMLGNFFVGIGQAICVGFYFVCKWMLAVVDFLQYFIQKLIGLDYWLKSGKKTIKGATDNDMLFKFLYNDMVQKVFRAMTAVFVVLLIIFTVVAIIRQEWGYITGGNFGDGKNSKNAIILKSLKAIALVLVFPMILIVGVISSNAILASLVNALNIDMASTFGGSIFSIAAQTGSRYRIYADGNERSAVSQKVTFYVNTTSGKCLAYGVGNEPQFDYEDDYHTYLGAIKASNMKTYTIDSVFRAVNPSDYTKKKPFSGYCVAMEFEDGVTKPMMVYCDSSDKEKYFYYLKNVLNVSILSANNKFNSDIYSDVKSSMKSKGSGSCPGFISGLRLDDIGKGDLIDACYNSWNYASIYMQKTAFENTLDYGIVENDVLEKFGLGATSNAKVMYNSEYISPYMDGGQFGVVQTRAEYYVMAEVIDFINEKQADLYVMDATSSSIKWDQAGYQLADKWWNGGTHANGQTIGGSKYYAFVTSYSENCPENEVGNVLYTAKFDTSNELEGSKYIFCWKRGNKYVPLINGYEGGYVNESGTRYDFKSTYYSDSYKGVVFAKGVFDTSSTNQNFGEPTYIQTSATALDGDDPISISDEKAYYYKMEQSGSFSQYAGSAASDTKATTADFQFNGITLPAAFENGYKITPEVITGTSDKIYKLNQILVEDDVTTLEPAAFNESFLTEMTISLQESGNNRSAKYANVKSSVSNTLTRYLFVTSNNYYFVVEHDSKDEFLRIVGVAADGTIGTVGSDTIKGLKITYNLKYTYKKGAVDETASVNSAMSSEFFEYTGQKGNYSIFKTQEMQFIKTTAKENGKPIINKAMYINAVFDTTAESLVTFGTDADLGKILYARPVDQSSEHIQQSVFYNFYLYSFMHGYVTTGSKVVKYSIAPDGTATLENIANTSVNEDMTFSFAANKDLSWALDETELALYDGKTYIATIYKNQQATTDTEVNATTIDGSVPTKINYDGNVYYNIKKMNAFTTEAELKTYFDTVSESLIIGFYRDNARTKFWHFDSNIGGLISGKFRFKMALFVKEIENEMSSYFTLDDGYLFDYFFDGHVKLGTFYVPSKVASPIGISFWIIMIASALIIKVLGTSLWGVIKRFYEITLYYLAMPAVAAAMPLDEKDTRFKTAIQTPLIGKVLSTYGVILGINAFFVLLAPVRSLSNVFTAEDVATSGSYFLKHLPIPISLLNSYVYIMFLLVAFTMINSLPGTISMIVTGKEGNDILSSGEKTKKQASETMKQAGGVISGQSVMEGASKIAKGAASFIPGGAIAKKAAGGIAGGVNNIMDRFKDDGAGDDDSESGSNRTGGQTDGGDQTGGGSTGGGAGGDGTETSSKRTGENADEQEGGATPPVDGATPPVDPMEEGAMENAVTAPGVGGPGAGTPGAAPADGVTPPTQAEGGDNPDGKTENAEGGSDSKPVDGVTPPQEEGAVGEVTAEQAKENAGGSPVGDKTPGQPGEEGEKKPGEPGTEGEKKPGEPGAEGDGKKKKPSFMDLVRQDSDAEVGRVKKHAHAGKSFITGIGGGIKNAFGKAAHAMKPSNVKKFISKHGTNFLNKHPKLKNAFDKTKSFVKAIDRGLGHIVKTPKYIANGVSFAARKVGNAVKASAAATANFASKMGTKFMAKNPWIAKAARGIKAGATGLKTGLTVAKNWVKARPATIQNAVKRFGNNLKEGANRFLTSDHWLAKATVKVAARGYTAYRGVKAVGEKLAKTKVGQSILEGAMTRKAERSAAKEEKKRAKEMSEHYSAKGEDLERGRKRQEYANAEADEKVARKAFKRLGGEEKAAQLDTEIQALQEKTQAEGFDANSKEGKEVVKELKKKTRERETLTIVEERIKEAETRKTTVGNAYQEKYGVTVDADKHVVGKKFALGLDIDKAIEEETNSGHQVEESKNVLASKRKKKEKLDEEIANETDSGKRKKLEAKRDVLIQEITTEEKNLETVTTVHEKASKKRVELQKEYVSTFGIAYEDDGDVQLGLEGPEHGSYITASGKKGAARRVRAFNGSGEGVDVNAERGIHFSSSLVSAGASGSGRTAGQIIAKAIESGESLTAEQIETITVSEFNEAAVSDTSFVENKTAARANIVRNKVGTQVGKKVVAEVLSTFAETAVDETLAGDATATTAKKVLTAVNGGKGKAGLLTSDMREQLILSTMSAEDVQKYNGLGADGKKAMLSSYRMDTSVSAAGEVGFVVTDTHGKSVKVDNDTTNQVVSSMISSGRISDEAINNAVNKTGTGENVDAAIAQNVAMAIDFESENANTTTSALASAVYSKAAEDDDIVAEAILRHVEGSKGTELYDRFQYELNLGEDTDFSNPKTRTKVLDQIKALRKSGNANVISTMDSESYGAEFTSVVKEQVASGAIKVTAWDLADDETKERFSAKTKANLREVSSHSILDGATEEEKTDIIANTVTNVMQQSGGSTPILQHIQQSGFIANVTEQELKDINPQVMQALVGKSDAESLSADDKAFIGFVKATNGGSFNGVYAQDADKYKRAYTSNNSRVAAFAALGNDVKATAVAQNNMSDVYAQAATQDGVLALTKDTINDVQADFVVQGITNNATREELNRMYRVYTGDSNASVNSASKEDLVKFLGSNQGASNLVMSQMRSEGYSFAQHANSNFELYYARTEEEKKREQELSVEAVRKNAPASVFHAFTASNIENKDVITRDLFAEFAGIDSETSAAYVETMTAVKDSGIDVYALNRSGHDNNAIVAAYKKAQMFGEIDEAGMGASLEVISKYLESSPAQDIELLKKMQSMSDADHDAIFAGGKHFGEVASTLLSDRLTGDQKEELIASAAASGYAGLSATEQDGVISSMARKDGLVADNAVIAKMMAGFEIPEETREVISFDGSSLSEETFMQFMGISATETREDISFNADAITEKSFLTYTGQKNVSKQTKKDIAHKAELYKKQNLLKARLRKNGITSYKVDGQDVDLDNLDANTLSVMGRELDARKKAGEAVVELTAAEKKDIETTSTSDARKEVYAELMVLHRKPGSVRTKKAFTSAESRQEALDEIARTSPEFQSKTATTVESAEIAEVRNEIDSKVKRNSAIAILRKNGVTHGHVGDKQIELEDLDDDAIGTMVTDLTKTGRRLQSLTEDEEFDILDGATTEVYTSRMLKKANVGSLDELAQTDAGEMFRHTAVETVEKDRSESARMAAFIADKTGLDTYGDKAIADMTDDEKRKAILELAKRDNVTVSEDEVSSYVLSDAGAADRKRLEARTSSMSYYELQGVTEGKSTAQIYGEIKDAVAESRDVADIYRTQGGLISSEDMRLDMIANPDAEATAFVAGRYASKISTVSAEEQHQIAIRAQYESIVGETDGLDLIADIERDNQTEIQHAQYYALFNEFASREGGADFIKAIRATEEYKEESKKLGFDERLFIGQKLKGGLVDSLYDERAYAKEDHEKRHVMIYDAFAKSGAYAAYIEQIKQSKEYKEAKRDAKYHDVEFDEKQFIGTKLESIVSSGALRDNTSIIAAVEEKTRQQEIIMRVNDYNPGMAAQLDVVSANAIELENKRRLANGSAARISAYAKAIMDDGQLAKKARIAFRQQDAFEGKDLEEVDEATRNNFLATTFLSSLNKYELEDVQRERGAIDAAYVRSQVDSSSVAEIAKKHGSVEDFVSDAYSRGISVDQALQEMGMAKSEAELRAEAETEYAKAKGVEVSQLSQDERNKAYSDYLDRKVVERMSTEDFDAVYTESKLENYGEEAEVFTKVKKGMIKRKAARGEISVVPDVSEMTPAQKREYEYRRNVIQQEIRNDSNPQILANTFKNTTLVNEGSIVETIIANLARDRKADPDAIRAEVLSKNNTYMTNFYGDLFRNNPNDTKLQAVYNNIKKHYGEDNFKALSIEEQNKAIFNFLNNPALTQRMEKNGMMASVTSARDEALKKAITDGKVTSSDLKGGLDEQAIGAYLKSHETIKDHLVSLAAGDVTLALDKDTKTTRQIDAVMSSSALQAQTALKMLQNQNISNNKLKEMIREMLTSETSRYYNAEMANLFKDTSEEGQTRAYATLAGYVKENNSQVMTNLAMHTYFDAGRDGKLVLKDSVAGQKGSPVEQMGRAIQELSAGSKTYASRVYDELSRVVSPTSRATIADKKNFFASDRSGANASQVRTLGEEFSSISGTLTALGRKFAAKKDGTTTSLTGDGLFSSLFTISKNVGTEIFNTTKGGIVKVVDGAFSGAVYKLTKKLPKTHAKYDQWNDLIQKKIDDVKKGQGAYKGFTRAQREAEVAKLESQKIVRELPENYYDMSSEEQANFIKQQNLYKHEAFTTNISKVIKQNIKMEAPKNNVFKRFADSAGYTFGFVGGMASENVKTRHKQDLDDIEAAVTRYNATKAMRNRSVDFGTNFENFARNYLSEKEAERVSENALNQFLAQMRGQVAANGKVINSKNMKDIKFNNLTESQQKQFIQIREDEFARKLNKNLSVATQKVALDNKLDPLTYTQEKGITTPNVRYRNGAERYLHMRSQVKTGGRSSYKGSVESRIASENRLIDLQAKYDKIVQFNNTFKGSKEEYRAALASFINDEDLINRIYNRYNSTFGSKFSKELNLERSSTAGQKRTVLNGALTQMQNEINRAKYNGFIPANNQTSSGYIGKTFVNATTRVEVEKSKNFADELSSTIKQFKLQQKTLSYDQLYGMLSPALRSGFGARKKTDFTSCGDDRKKEELIKYLQRRQAQAVKKVNNNMFFAGDRHKLTNLNGTYVEKSSVTSTGVSPVIMNAIRTSGSNVYQTLVQNYNNARTKVDLEEKNIDRLSRSLRDIMSGPQNAATRREAEKIRQALAASRVKLKTYNSMYSDAESKKKAFEQSFATREIQQAVAKNAAMAYNTTTASRELFAKYRFPVRQPNGTVEYIKDGSTKAKEVTMIIGDFLRRYRYQLQYMIRQSILPDLKEIRQDLSNDFGRNYANLKAVTNRLKAQIRKTSAEVKSNAKEASEENRELKNKLNNNLSKIQTTERELIFRLRALGIDVNDISQIVNSGPATR